jgi:hypothetical protein
MTDHTIVATQHGLPSLHVGERCQKRGQPVAHLRALKVLGAIGLIVTLAGCVSTREGDYETPFVRGDFSNGSRFADPLAQAEVRHVLPGSTA